ncbi:MAG TPA: (Fe-S)-binding protein, partial [Candidatus Dormibacteraeota bacterium]|nr:(Fe-S)-binding protein [Candidatus Dormibacteraeota bacterium]
CPTHEVTRNERHQPWGHAREDVAAARSAAGFGGGAAAESAYACATCAACTVPCEVDGVETPDLVWAVRATVWRAGSAPTAAAEAVARAAAGLVLATEDPPGWIDPAPTMAALAGLATAGARLLLVPGCGALGRRPAAAVAAGRALAALGAPFRVEHEHRCCGAIARAAGDGEGARRAAGAVVDAARAAGVETIAVQSPSCAAHLSREAGGVRVAPFATVVRDLVEGAGGTGAAAGGDAARRTAYHDPCMLARHLGVTAAPREALRALGAGDIAELEHRGPATRCSGRGGLLAATNPRIARGYLDLLVADVRASGATRLVTGCATCAGVLEPELDGVEVQELAEAVMDAVHRQGVA